MDLLIINNIIYCLLIVIGYYEVFRDGRAWGGRVEESNTQPPAQGRMASEVSNHDLFIIMRVINVLIGELGYESLGWEVGKMVFEAA